MTTQTAYNKNFRTVDQYRLDLIEKSLDKFTARVESKLDKISENFATKAALSDVKAEADARIDEITDRVGRLESKKQITQNITTVILICSLITNLFTVYELFFH